MEQLRSIVEKPFVRFGLMLGIGFVLAQYVFYFGGRNVIMDATFGSTIEILSIAGLYLGMSQCKRLQPEARFWQLFGWGIGIIGISVVVKTIFSILLYGSFSPELGQEYAQTLYEQMSEVVEVMKDVPKEQYKIMLKAMLNSVSIPIFEGVSLFFSGAIYTLFIASLLNMFRK